MVTRGGTEWEGKENVEKGREWFGESGSESEQDSTTTELGLGEPGSRKSGTLPGSASGKVEVVRIWTEEGTRLSKEGLGRAWLSGGADSMGVESGAREEGLGGLAGGGDGREEEKRSNSTVSSTRVFARIANAKGIGGFKIEDYAKACIMETDVIAMEKENFASDKTQKGKVRLDSLVRGLAEEEFAYEGIF
ncbi:TCP family transcription factor [Striga asiatica]|uniref:TCP family transcription factor n=1 Tax=Striga asiatica TaxID=4170 RepID=A0A5A7Q862_STRAF|nr:TCP family transcription factor [Striga asiatica]